MVAFPTNIRYFDISTLDEEIEDTSLTPSKMEGGYVVSRPRHTRPGRRTWSGSYRELNQADKDTLEDFWRNVVKGRSNSFTWTHPISAEEVTVRFGEMRMKFKYTGIGMRVTWETETLVFEEV